MAVHAAQEALHVILVILVIHVAQVQVGQAIQVALMDTDRAEAHKPLLLSQCHQWDHLVHHADHLVPRDREAHVAQVQVGQVHPVGVNVIYRVSSRLFKHIASVSIILL